MKDFILDGRKGKLNGKCVNHHMACVHYFWTHRCHCRTVQLRGGIVYKVKSICQECNIPILEGDDTIKVDEHKKPIHFWHRHKFPETAAN